MIARLHSDDDLLQFLDRNSDPSHELTEQLDSCTELQERLHDLSSGGLSWEEVNQLMEPDVLSPWNDQSSGTKNMTSPRAIHPDEGRLLSDPRNQPDSSSVFLTKSEHPGSMGRFARYEIMEILGRGGMGIVMRGYDATLNRHAAIKVLAPELASSAPAKQRFWREAKSAAAVVHQHVIPIHHVETCNGLPYLVMPVVDGKNVDDRVRQDGQLDIMTTVRIAYQIALGLSAAHEQGLVHRDIKPGNILLENGVERVQITDFGLARAADDVSMTRSGVIAGTPQYMSPEQAHGDSIDHRSDLFSLGSVIYYMRTGRSPFRAETTMGVLHRIVTDQPRPLREVQSDTLDWLHQIVHKLLSKKPDDRYQSAAEVAEVLRAWYAHLQQPSQFPRPLEPAVEHETSSTAKTQVKPGRSRTIGRVLTAVIAASLVGFLSIVVIAESNKGTLRIETNSSSPVPVTIRRGDEVVDHLVVSHQGAGVRLKAGHYIIEVAEKDASFEIAGDQVLLKRGDTWLARITESRQIRLDKSLLDSVTNTPGDTKEFNWPKNWGGGPGNYLIDADSTTKHSGASSAKLKCMKPNPRSPYGTLIQSASAEPFAGKRVKMTAFVKTNDIQSAGLWLRIDSDKRGTVAFDNMSSRPISGTQEWTKTEIVIDLPEDAKMMTYGVILHGTGTLWLDDLEIQSVDSSVPTTSPVIRPTMQKITIPNDLPETPLNTDFEIDSKG